jgi:tRNA (cmo5U34)-methyltransferase
MRIPDRWTFKSPEVATHFDQHVREQLPWYEMATAAVAHLGRHYIGQNGLCYDVGASTGNISAALKATLIERRARCVSIEEAPEMAVQFRGHGEIVVADALRHKYEPFDFCVCFLVLMFMPIEARASFVRRLAGLIKPGGALVVFDKIESQPGYLGTALRRLTMSWKVATGTEPADIIRKELSLGGVQRPINPAILGKQAKPFFLFGEFGGWIIESPEIQ